MILLETIGSDSFLQFLGMGIGDIATAGVLLVVCWMLWRMYDKKDKALTDIQAKRVEDYKELGGFIVDIKTAIKALELLANIKDRKDDNRGG